MIIRNTTGPHVLLRGTGALLAKALSSSKHVPCHILILVAFAQIATFVVLPCIQFCFLTSLLPCLLPVLGS